MRREGLSNEDAAEGQATIIRLVTKETMLGVFDIYTHDDMDRLAQRLPSFNEPAQSRGEYAGGCFSERVEDLWEGMVRGAGVVETREEVVDASGDGGFEQGKVDVPAFPHEQGFVVAVEGLEFEEPRRVVLRDVCDDLLSDAFEVILRA